MKKMLLSVLVCALGVLTLGLCACEEGEEVLKKDCNHPEKYLKTTLKDATCAAEGKEVVTCTNCGAQISERTIPATGLHQKDAGEILKNATCSEDGEKVFHCFVCKTELAREVIPATGEHTKDEGEIVSEATCGKDGEKVYRCAVCKTELKKEVIPATGEHQRDEGTILKEATCLESGEILYHCTACDEEWTEEISDLLEHEFELSSAYWQEEGYEAPTEGHSAVIPYTCKNCKTKFKTEFSDESFPFSKELVRKEDQFSTDTPFIFDEENKYLIINLTGSNLQAIFKELSEKNLYDAESCTLTIPAAINSVSLQKVKVRGFKKPNESFSLSTEVCDRMDITLENLSYTAPSGKVGLDFKNANEAHVEIVGLVSVTGGDGADAIRANQLEIAGKGNLTAQAGGGKNGVVADGNGKAGGVGIEAGALSLSLEGAATIAGGNGGAAFNRPSGDNGGEGEDGRPGYTGGNGGAAIKAESITVKAGKYTLTAGGGGRGGDASECNRSEITNKGSTSVTGGRGGTGGNGADAVSAQSLSMRGGTLTATGGDGGDSGKRGGCHDDDHSGFVFLNGTTTAKDGPSGTAGKAGSAVKAGCTLEGEELVTKTDGTPGNVTEELNQC